MAHMSFAGLVHAYRTGMCDVAKGAFDKSPVVKMAQAAASYADNYWIRYGQGIGVDTAIGPEWAKMLGCARNLLNGDLTPELNCGQVDAMIVEMLEVADFDPEQYR